jgi:hypothetical protein
MILCACQPKVPKLLLLVLQSESLCLTRQPEVCLQATTRLIYSAKWSAAFGFYYTIFAVLFCSILTIRFLHFGHWRENRKKVAWSLATPILYVYAENL